MALLVKNDGTAVVEEPKTTAAQTATDTGNAENTGTTTKTNTSTSSKNTSVPEAAAAGTTQAGKGVDFSNITAEYDGKYDQQLADLYNQITQRKPFEYNADDDLLYQQYVDKYTKGGQLAMMDTMGQAAALTGGYGNSYAQHVGQQTYDEYMTGLADQMLNLEQRAYGRYQDEGNRLMQQYGMLGDLANTDYNRWRDMKGDAMTDAALRAAAGDFDAYKEIYGEDAANRMQAVWAAQNLMPLYAAGQMDAETYKSIAGVYPVGYVEPGAAGSGSSGSWYVDAYKYLASIGATQEAATDYYNKMAPYAR